MEARRRGWKEGGISRVLNPRFCNSRHRSEAMQEFKGILSTDTAWGKMRIKIYSFFSNIFSCFIKGFIF